MNGEETEQMKSYEVFVRGGTNLDLSVSAVSIVERNKESAGPGGGHRGRLSDTTAGSPKSPGPEPCSSQVHLKSGNYHPG